MFTGLGAEKRPGENSDPDAGEQADGAAAALTEEKEDEGQEDD